MTQWQTVPGARAAVLEEAKKRYGKPIHMNALEAAMQEDSFEDAVDLVICETQYQDGSWKASHEASGS